MISCLNIDWLSFFGSCDEKVDGRLYERCPRPFGTKIFADVIDYKKDGEIWFTVTKNPRSTALADSLAIVKVANFVLYRSDKFDVIKNGLKDIGFKIKGFSRLDLCLDFNYFANGYNGHTLISQFIKSNLLRNGRGKFSVQGVQKFECNFEYLKFGGSNSEVKAYLYNKTKEMQDVKDKPYIREQWEIAGLKQDVPVYRLEFSMNSDAVKNLQNTETGTASLSVSAIENADNLSDIYYCLYDRFFDFRKNNRTKNKSRMERVDLIKREEIKVFYNAKKYSKESGRMEKILMHNMYVYVSKYGDGEVSTYDHSNALLNNLMEKTDMREYVARKIPQWDNEMEG